jgi:hypothetical protein
MSTDTLTEAVANMESAWRRLREVLDGPDVAAALVERNTGPRHMADAPRDGTFIYLDFGDGRGTPCAKWGHQAARNGGKTWVDYDGVPILQPGRVPVGWWPVETPAPRSEVRPMSTAPRDGTKVRIHLADGRNYVMKWGAGRLWWDDCEVGYSDRSATGWSPVK